MSIIQLQAGIPRAAARVDGRQIPPIYMSNSGQFTDAGLTRVGAGIYRLTLSSAINVNDCDVMVTAESPDGAQLGMCNYRIISTTVIEVIISDGIGYGAFDARFSILVTQVT